MPLRPRSVEPSSRRSISGECAKSCHPLLDLWADFFSHLPLAARVLVWMVSAWLSALPIEWVEDNYDFDRCLQLLPGYLAMGSAICVLHLLLLSVKWKLAKGKARPAWVQRMLRLNHLANRWLGISV